MSNSREELEDNDIVDEDDEYEEIGDGISDSTFLMSSHKNVISCFSIEFIIVVEENYLN